MRFWPASYPKKCTFEDVRFFKLLCQGSEPDNNTDIYIHVNSKCFGLCKALLGSGEFARSILVPLNLGKQVGHVAFEPEQAALIQRGLSRHFKVKADTPDNWGAALKYAALSLRFLKAFDDAKTGFSAGWLQEKLAALPTATIPEFTAHIRCLTAGVVEGNAYDRADPARALKLDVFINDAYVGTCTTGGQSRETQEETGTETQAEFTYTINVPPHLSERDHLYISLYEHETGALVCPARELPTVDIRHSLLIEQLGKKLDDVVEVYRTEAHAELAVSQLKKHLPAIEQFAAIPLSEYRHYRKWFRAPNAPVAKGVLPNISIAKAPDYSYDPTADVVIFLDEGASLQENALAWVQYTATKNPNAAVFYGDYDETDINGTLTPQYMARFDRDFFYASPRSSCAYAVKREKLEEAGGLDANEPAKHAELWLRLLERNDDSHFIKLPHAAWHVVQQNGCHLAPIKLVEHFDRLDMDVSIQPHTDKYGGPVIGTFNLRYAVDSTLPKLAVIIPAKDTVELTKGCVNSLRDTLEYPEHTEIIIIDNGSIEQETKDWLHWANGMDGIHVLLHDAPFNWSEMNNKAVATSDAEYCLFLNNDTVALDQGWDHILRGHLNREDVGLVGARLLFADGTIQFAGYIMNPDNIALKEAYGETPDVGGYQNRSRLTHATSAVIGAFMACRREVFEKIGGFDAERFPVAFNDIDFSLAVTELGYKNLYEPAITFHHLESKSRGYDALDAKKAGREQKEREIMRDKWGERLQSDPYYPEVFLKSEPTHSLLAAPKKAGITS